VCAYFCPALREGEQLAQDREVFRDGESFQPGAYLFAFSRASGSEEYHLNISANSDPRFDLVLHDDMIEAAGEISNDSGVPEIPC
jgi:hypothetical protein